MGYAVFCAMLLMIAFMVYRNSRLLRMALAASDANVAAVFGKEVPDIQEVKDLMQSSSMDQMASGTGERFAIAYVIAMGMKAVTLGTKKTRRPSVVKAVANSTFMIITNASSRFPLIYESYASFHAEHGASLNAPLVPSEHFRLLLERIAAVKSIRKR